MEVPHPDRLSQRVGARLAELVTGRLASWFGVCFWAAVLAVALPFASRLGSVETSRLTDFLPAGAASTTALALDRRFPSGRAQPTVVVYHRSGGLRPADLAVARADVARLGHQPGLVDPVGPIASSRPGTAIVTVGVLGDETAVVRNVEHLRAVVGPGRGGLEIETTGVAAVQADLLGAFSGVDTKLLVLTAGLVALILVLTYRSPVLWLAPLACVGIAAAVTDAVVFALGKGGLTVTGESAALATVIVFGAGTDYALLLTARYREELHRHAEHTRAMVVAWRRAAPAVAASSLTVAAALACLLLARYKLTSDFGVVGIVGVLSAAVVVLGAYPALLLVAGRRVFWPSVPRHVPSVSPRGVWAKVAAVVARGHRPVWIVGAVLFVAMGLGVLTVNTNLSSINDLPASAPSVRGDHLLAAAYPAGEVAPVDVVVTDGRLAAAVHRAVAGSGVVASVGAIERAGHLARFSAVLHHATGSAGFAAVRTLRADTEAVAGSAVLIGGQTAQDLDTAEISHHDLLVVVPTVLAVVLVVLVLVLRALLGPLVVMASVALTFAAALGVMSAGFIPLLGLPGTDPTVPLLTFVFLVALGIDYNIFLLTRVREEALRADSTAGVRHGVATTGSVLTSAGLVLAATFSVLAILPVVASKEIGIVVALGVLADTFLIRTVVVPALAIDLGPRFWWPTAVAAPARRSPVGSGAGPEQLG